MIASWPTREGWAAIGLSFLLVNLGAIGGNNLIVLVACIGCAALAVDLVGGRWNLGGLQVGWRLPEELFAGQACRGAFVVTNRRRRGAAHRIALGDGFATASVSELGPGDEAVAWAWWRLPRRGPFAFRGVQLRSTWPLGLFAHSCELAEEAHGVVYPRPLAGRFRDAGDREGDARSDDRRDQTGDFRELRPYRPGDRIRSIHWRTSARVGQPMVVVRGGERTDAVLVVVRADAEVEEELGRATGAVLDATSRGQAVGLVLPGDDALQRPSVGTRWRRQLLDALALYDGDPG
ncbi:MAG: DUF58 domain-containing protein [Myxococcota bacterium]